MDAFFEIFGMYRVEPKQESTPMAEKERKKPKVGSWILRMRCIVTKEVTCDNCTEEEARNDPWEHATDEHEIDQVDWEIERVESND